MEMTRRVPAVRIRDGSRSPREETVAREETLCLYLNGNLLVRLLCSPSDLEDLAVGFLFSEGLIGGLDDILSIEPGSAETTLFVRVRGEGPDAVALSGAVRTSGCGAGVTLSDMRQGIEPVRTDVRIGSADILSLSREFERSSQLFRETGGVHACALASGEGLLLLREDIGRHNALDKALGAAVRRKDVDLSRCVVYISGRISSEMVAKAARAGLGMILSRAAPTSAAVELAAGLGVCLVGFVRGARMNVYTHPDRVV
jgi:FdhD protein